MISVGVWLSLARAPGLGPGGRRFESCHPDLFYCCEPDPFFLFIIVKQFAYQVSYLKYTVIETMYHVIYDWFIS